MGAGGLTGSGYLACLPFTRVTRNHALKCKDGEVGERGESNSGGKRCSRPLSFTSILPTPAKQSVTLFQDGEVKFPLVFTA